MTMKQVMFLIIAIILLSANYSGASTSASVEVAGVPFAKVHPTPDGTLTFRGGALLRYMVFIKAYAGALYLPDGADHRQVLALVPRRLELSYFHAISAEDFASATQKKIADNLSPEALAAMAERIDQFNALYRDVQPGDRYALTYSPGQGTELSLNGEALGRIAGDDFAAAVFAIWLGPDPIDDDFKSALLGRA
jgi:hypothetical protein